MRGAIETKILKCWLMICNSKKSIKHQLFEFVVFSVLSYSKCSLQCNTEVSLRANFNAAFCLCLGFKHMGCMSSPQDFLGCTIRKKVEEH